MTPSLIGLRVRITRQSTVRLGQIDRLTGILASTDNGTLVLSNVAGMPTGSTVSTPIAKCLTIHGWAK